MQISLKKERLHPFKKDVCIFKRASFIFKRDERGSFENVDILFEREITSYVKDVRISKEPQICAKEPQISEKEPDNASKECCSVLQSVAVCCSVLQCVAVCCSVLPCVAGCCSVMRCVVLGYF